MGSEYAIEDFNAELLYLAEDLRLLHYEALKAVESMNLDPCGETMNPAYGKLVSLAHALIPTGRFKVDEENGIGAIIGHLHKMRQEKVKGGEWHIDWSGELNGALFRLEEMIAEQNLFRRPTTEPQGAKKRL